MAQRIQDTEFWKLKQTTECFNLMKPNNLEDAMTLLRPFAESLLLNGHSRQDVLDLIKAAVPDAFTLPRKKCLSQQP